MVWQDSALGLAGVVGAAVAVFHGIVVQRLMVRPLASVAQDARFSGATRRLIAPLLHFSTAVWFVGGIALVIAATMLTRDARLTIAVMVGTTYLLGLAANFWATRGRHPGWMLLALAVALIVAGALKPGN